MALKACQQVLLNVQLQDQGQVSDSSPAPVTFREENKEEERLKTKDSCQQDQQNQVPQTPDLPSARQSWLLRLFESRLFDVSMAVSYLYKSKDPGVQAYIGNRLFSFAHNQVDFYLPQLLNMYVHMDEEVGDAIRPYLVSPQRASALSLADCSPAPKVVKVFTVICCKL